jgi:hypothetical protein
MNLQEYKTKIRNQLVNGIQNQIHIQNSIEKGVKSNHKTPILVKY